MCRGGGTPWSDTRSTGGSETVVVVPLWRVGWTDDRVGLGGTLRSCFVPSHRSLGLTIQDWCTGRLLTRRIPESKAGKVFLGTVDNVSQCRSETAPVHTFRGSCPGLESFTVPGKRVDHKGCCEYHPNKGTRLLLCLLANCAVDFILSVIITLHRAIT